MNVTSSADLVSFTGVQLEVGSVATEFEHRSYGEELALCQRYYQRLGGVSYAGIAVGQVYSNSVTHIGFTYPKEMRGPPAYTYSNLILTDRIAYDAPVSSIVDMGSSANGGQIKFNHATTGSAVARDANVLAVKNGTTGWLAFDAEL
jgi:hypothetical protein